MKRANGTEWSTITPSETSILVTPPQSGRAPSTPIMIEHFRQPDIGCMEFAETADDWCKLTIALRRSRVCVRRNGLTLHTGPILPGMMRLSEPGDQVSGQVFSGAEAVVISLPRSRLTGLLPASRTLNSIRPTLRHDARTEHLGRTLLGLRQMDARYRGLFGGGIVDALLAILFDHGGRSDGERHPNGPFSPEQVVDILDFAEARIGQKLDLASWAAHFGMPPQEFARRFRSATGSAPYAHFLRRRIERAQELMTETSSPLTEVALEVGFSSQSHFTDAFRRVTGIAPGRWRRAQA